MDKKKPHNTPEDATQAIDESTQKEPQAEMQEKTTEESKKRKWKSNI